MRKPEKLAIRTLTAIVFGIFLIGSILLGQWTFSLLTLFFVVAGLLEFYNLLSNGDNKPQIITGIAAGIIAYLAILLTSNGLMGSQYLMCLLLLPIIIVIFEMWSNSSTPFQNIGITILGIIYLPVPFALLVSFFPIGVKLGLEKPGLLILGFFIILWVFDSAAYFIGSAVGKNKLFERISPKKTWEGLAGGIVFGLITAFILSMVMKQLGILEWLVMAFIIMIFGTLGDLSESMLKRSLKVKDSGKLLPGHGGILDRFDAVLLSVPVLYLYIRFFIK